MDENALNSLQHTLARNVRDWSTAKTDAWLWGVICGWGDEDDECWDELKHQHGWSEEACAHLRALHADYTRRMGEAGGEG